MDNVTLTKEDYEALLNKPNEYAVKLKGESSKLGKAFKNLGGGLSMLAKDFLSDSNIDNNVKSKRTKLAKFIAPK